VAVASAGPYASLHLAPDRWPREHKLSFLQAGCPSCRPNNSVKALKGYCLGSTHTRLHTRLTALFSRTTQVGRYQKGITNLGFTEARDSEWQWHQLGHMQVCTLLQTDNHASTSPLSFWQAGCPSCHPNNSVEALKATWLGSNRLITTRAVCHLAITTFVDGRWQHLPSCLIGK